MYFLNVDGIIFYTTDRDAVTKIAASGATIANIRRLYRQNSFSMNAVKAMGASAVIVAGVNIAQKLAAAQRIMMPANMAIMRF